MSGRGKGYTQGHGKGLLGYSVKRIQRRIVKPAKIAKPLLQRLMRMAGCDRIASDSIGVTRAYIRAVLAGIIHDAYEMAELANRRTVDKRDISQALRRIKAVVYGFDGPEIVLPPSTTARGKRKKQATEEDAVGEFEEEDDDLSVGVEEEASPDDIRVEMESLDNDLGL